MGDSTPATWDNAYDLGLRRRHAVRFGRGSVLENTALPGVAERAWQGVPSAHGPAEARRVADLTGDASGLGLVGAMWHLTVSGGALQHPHRRPACSIKGHGTA